MKRLLVLVIAAVMLLGLLAGCGGDSGDVMEITDRAFIMQVDNIYTNSHLYLGRMIRYEGIFETVNWHGAPSHIVFRNAPGCCGDDGVVGFEVYLDGAEPFADNAWVAITGELEEHAGASGGIRLRITSIEELDERGMEFVNQ